MNIRMDLYTDIHLWDDALQTLGAERCQPLLPLLGVPSTIANNSQPVLEAARQYFLFEIEQLDEQDNVAQTTKRLERFFATVVDEYDAETARQLYAWSLRHFVDVQHRNCLWTWSILLTQLVQHVIDEDNSLADSALSDSAVNHIKRVLLVQFGPRVESWDAEQLAAASLRSPTLFERRILGSDVMAVAQEVVKNEHTHQFWQEVYSRLTTAERLALERWGREEARAIGLPGKWLRFTKHLLV